MRSVGIDVGGTFTDLAAIAPDGTVEVRKVLTTPHEQGEGVAAALQALGGRVQRVVHGTTVATNALLERTGADVVLCATAGFTDLLALRRQDRASLYDLAAHHPAPLVAPHDTVPVAERTGPDGVLRALRAADAADVADVVANRGPGAVAVSLLHAYAHPAHERALVALLRERLPADVDVVASSEVYPEVREYERTATAVAEAYLRPVVRRYLERLTGRLAAIGAPAPSVMSSSGGMRPAADAARYAASLALSGPAGGVVGAAAVLRVLGIDRALTIDIGGTSADVGVILGGAPLVESGGSVAGVPIALPRVLVETVSAGGGSILWVDDGGALRVGPRSAGAVPGPAAFARGGALATLTDAHVVLGNVAPRAMSGGITIDAARAHAAVGRVAEQLGASAAQVARAAVAIADASMARALRRVSVERGIDPRDCVLVAFGGGGPLHGCGLAEGLGMTRVLVPPHAGVLSALGLAIAPERREAMASVMRTTDAIEPAPFASMLEALAASLHLPGLAAREWLLRARYLGQGHELEVPVRPGAAGGEIARDFIAMHGARYGFTLDRVVEVVSARAVVSGPARELTLARHDAPDAVRGPATLSLDDATMLVAAGWTARPLAIGGWMLEREPA